MEMVEEICKHCKHCFSCMCGDEFKDCKLKKSASIEERAREKCRFFETGKLKPIGELAKAAYIQGATEQKAIDEDAIHAIVEEQVLKAIEKQKAIDIDKACEWLRSNYADAEYSPFLVKFRKAMEEETL